MIRITTAAFAGLLLAACTTHTQREMQSANKAVENAWKAAEKGDWLAARNNAAVIAPLVRSGVDARPVRKVAGAGVDLRPLLAAWEKSAARPFANASALPAFKAAGTAMLVQCAACHAAAGKPETKIFEPGK